MNKALKRLPITSSCSFHFMMSITRNLIKLMNQQTNEAFILYDDLSFYTWYEIGMKQKKI